MTAAASQFAGGTTGCRSPTLPVTRPASGKGSRRSPRERREADTVAHIDIFQVDELLSLRGRSVLDEDGETIGKVEQVWVDNVNGQPEWATVSLGRSKESRYVPLRAADIRDDDVVVAYTKDQVESAPEFRPGEATVQDEHRLYRHYNQPLPAPPPPEVRNPFVRVQPVWAPTHGAGGSDFKG
jgi:sporulation protein YlmC with PRC-barrel domain